MFFSLQYKNVFAFRFVVRSYYLILRFNNKQINLKSSKFPLRTFKCYYCFRDLSIFNSIFDTILYT